MHIQHVLQILLRHIQNRFFAVPPRIVDQNRHRADLLRQRLHKRNRVRRIRHIEHAIVGFGAELLHGFFEHILASAGNHNVGACLHKALRHREPETRSAARNQCAFAFQTEGSL